MSVSVPEGYVRCAWILAGPEGSVDVVWLWRNDKRWTIRKEVLVGPTQDHVVGRSVDFDLLPRYKRAEARQIAEAAVSEMLADLATKGTAASLRVDLGTRDREKLNAKIGRSSLGKCFAIAGRQRARQLRKKKET